MIGSLPVRGRVIVYISRLAATAASRFLCREIHSMFLRRCRPPQKSDTLLVQSNKQDILCGAQWVDSSTLSLGLLLHASEQTQSTFPTTALFSVNANIKVSHISGK